MGRRPPKRRRKDIELSSSSSEDEEENEEAPALHELKKAPKLAKNRVATAKRENRGLGGPRESEDENQKQEREMREALFDSNVQALEHIPFCCAVCTCSASRKQRVQGEDDLLEPGEGYLSHRRCCHGFFDEDQEDYCHPLLAADQAKLELLDASEDEAKKNAPGELEWVTKHEIKAGFKEAKKQEAKFYNDDGDEHAADKLRSNAEHVEGIEEPFKELVKQIEAGEMKRDGVVVVDMFAGIGTASVVLKRLGIKIKKMIHVEHDKIATHVYRFNHDRTYNKELPEDGGIVHVYYRRFETFEAQYEAVLKQHGPIDLVIGGPPCVDYSTVNVRREGSEGDQGQFMVRFGRLIRAMERLQQVEFDGHRLFFLAENVVFQGDDKDAVLDAFGIDWDPIDFDAKYVSPTRRNRHFVTNIYSQALVDFNYEGAPSHSHPSSCLEEGFVPAEEIIAKDQTLSKAPCFMASSTRIDERNTLRMYVFQPTRKNGKYYGRPMLTVERERMMGYPEGYVGKPVRELFQELLDDGLSLLDVAYIDELSWKKKLRSDLHTFAGNYHEFEDHVAYKFVAPLRFEDPVAVEMAPPFYSTNAASKPSFFTAEEYAKHLIGNAYSVPVVELLLGSLSSVFAHQEYPLYNYRYRWEEVQVEETSSNEDDSEAHPTHIREVASDGANDEPAGSAAQSGSQEQESHTVHEHEAPTGDIKSEPGSSFGKGWRIPRRRHVPEPGTAEGDRKPAARTTDNIAEPLRRPAEDRKLTAFGNISPNPPDLL